MLLIYISVSCEDISRAHGTFGDTWFDTVCKVSGAVESFICSFLFYLSGADDNAAGFDDDHMGKCVFAAVFEIKGGALCEWMIFTALRRTGNTSGRESMPANKY